MLGRIRSFVDSLLHPLRRWEAHRLLRQANPRTILFVCTGNICRSPFAAALFARRTPPGVAGQITISSAGFVGPGRPSPEYALSTARDYDVDLRDHRSATLTTQTLQKSDLVVVMSPEQQQGISGRTAAGAKVLILGDLDPLPIKKRTILDPWDGPPAAFAESYSRIDRCVGELVRILWGGT